MEFEVRPIKAGDIAAVARIRAQTWESSAFWELRIPLYLSGEHSPQHALPERAAFVASDANAVAGFIAGHRTRRYGCDGELQWIDVAEEQRRRGIANALLQAMGEWFVGRQAQRICVDVDPKNQAARALYTKHGAQPLNGHWMVWKDARRMGAPSSFDVK